jgi:hypothetical protein
MAIPGRRDDRFTVSRNDATGSSSQTTGYLAGSARDAASTARKREGNAVRLEAACLAHCSVLRVRALGADLHLGRGVFATDLENSIASASIYKSS